MAIWRSIPTCHRCVTKGGRTGTQTKEHSHPFYELALIFRGGSVFGFAENELEAHAGEALLIPPGTSHCEKWESPGECFFGWIGFSFPDGEPKGLRDLACRPLSMLNVQRELRINFDRIRQEVSSRTPTADARIALALNDIFLLIDREITSKPKIIPTVSSLSPKQARIVEAAKNTIRANFEHPLQISELASTYYLSPAYFSTLFSAHIGIPPIRYLSQVRLEKARELLTTTRLTLDQIAKAIGFLDASHLSKQFRKTYGETPGAYRRPTVRGLRSESSIGFQPV